MVTEYKLFVGKFPLVQQLMDHGITPQSMERSPFDMRQQIWIFEGTREAADICKGYYDARELPYSKSLSKLIELLDREAVTV